MAPYYPPPDSNQLLHPLLACLPIAFISTQPPPALLPLLSPILRQRVKLLSETRSTSEASWLPLLCWETADAAELPRIIENISFEAHPVSGEMEFGEIGKVEYRRLDEETLQSRTSLPDMGLVILYTWCINDPEGGEDGWRISEFKPLKDPSNDGTRPWYPTFTSADEHSEEDGEKRAQVPVPGISLANGNDHKPETQEEDDDAYWSQYDQRQGETPAGGLTPAPRATTGDPEEDYYSRYDSVQPEMDAEDPTEDTTALGESTLHGNAVVVQRTEPIASQDTKNIIHTRPSSSGSSPVAHLEQSAEQQSQAEIAIQHHVSYSIKSLYRLSKGAGIDSSEFRRLVQNELECLSMLDER